MSESERGEESAGECGRVRLRAGGAWALAALTLPVLDFAAWIHPTAMDIEVKGRV